jgi:hypothetical protein
VVVTGNHYLLDILAGGLIALLTLAISHYLPRRGTSGSQPEAGGSSEAGPLNPTRHKGVFGSRDGELVSSGPDR